MESGYDSLLYFLNITTHVQFKPNLVYLSSTVLVKRIFIQKQKQKKTKKQKQNKTKQNKTLNTKKTAKLQILQKNSKVVHYHVSYGSNFKNIRSSRQEISKNKNLFHKELTINLFLNGKRII